MLIKHKQYECKVQFGQYGNGNTAIQLIDEEDGQVVAVASVNGEVKIGKNIVGIKTWSENEGIVQSLIDGNVIEKELFSWMPSGFVNIEYYKLTKQAFKELRKQELKNS